MKIYTKTGDKGKTSLLSGTRVSKSHIRINTYGTIDELNSHIGLLRDQKVNENRVTLLLHVQETLFTMGSILASDPARPIPDSIPKLRDEDIISLEKEIDRMEENLPTMQNFILPGGHQSVSYCHITRCVCRRAERLLTELDQSEPVDPKLIIYLNRLSDYLFVLARKMSQELNVKEIAWRA